MFDLGIISDEVSDDFAEACALICAWDLSHVELRLLWGKNVLQLAPDELERALALLREHELTVTAVASPVFKAPLDGRARPQEADFALPGAESFEAQLELLRHACSLAQRLGTRMVRVFTFWREPWRDGVLAELVEKFGPAAAIAREHEVLLAIENEPVCLVGSGEELGRLGHALASQLPEELAARLGLLWDPGNALAGGEAVPYPDGYRALAGLPLSHVHLKDLTMAGAEPRFVPLGEGEVDFRGQLRALERDGYRGRLVLEPHYRPPGVPRHEAARRCVEAARELLNEVRHSR